ncbi:MFS transporter [bacterium]|nr:MFS transporter [bacterium]
MSAKFRLSFMMFLQYAVWGSWYPGLSEYLINTLGFTGAQVGAIYATLPFATAIAPFIGGQFADRYFATQYVIAFLHLAGGAFLIFVSRVTDYTTMMWLMFLYCMLFAPTLALTNSIALVNLDNPEKDFGRIRVWGTLGWIAAGIGLSAWRIGANKILGASVAGDTLLMAGVLSFVMGLQALTLPHTPPKKEASNPWAFVESFKMLKDKNFAILIVIAFIVSTELMFYYVLTGPFLVSDRIGVSTSNMTTVMVIAQLAEIFVMAFALPYFMPKYGIRKTMVFGILAWPVRYIIFAIGYPAWLVIASLALHGFCYVFFFTAIQVYVDKVAPPDTRASAQSFIAIVTLGLGNFLGSLFTGWIRDYFTADNVTNWTGVFLVPTVLTIICAFALIVFFKDDNKQSAVTQ